MSSFVVHEHHSKKLHYDLRLEIGGALKSWTIPKGPSMNPKDKRLAVMVDDHPLEYGIFEGIIPEGHYGAGPVIIWDSGTYDSVKQDIIKGKIEFYLRGKKLKGLFVLTRMKGKEKEWLFIKKNDEYSDGNFEIRPELTEERRRLLQEKIPSCHMT
ncbi:MAG TPA: DNA polymerase ligase N-terminal domain-containing protein [Syntrophorhabdus sp.]|jgi:bifunctional non-homologous end joining protein LigD|nr:DNA polymerase ligase N-terminal domain-containing protein [Pseudomonadota bacterium]OQB76402.1 MAG: putative DNA ligase-like protein [Deltaproteobacteria bacterium ADurb.Bin135]HNS79567.1 DNA polymerase ligase N-terminal domain-containing protein [Syntrophorhabdus sp.]HPW36137.1 DNA polymerase ligase N-terminal domain-containing protein [Syntrophorhabdus sp.]HQO63930.1 DNA polymerase ligase N-terminal domain-containing protein [Syntrophorhabdus sp.]